MKHRRLPLFVCTVTALASAAVETAHADDAADSQKHEGVRAATLVYDAPPARLCPDEASFRDRVGARLGVDPFVATSSTSMIVRIRPRGGSLAGTAELRHPGSPPRSREITTREGCEALVSALAATVALALDPSGQAARSAGAKESPPPISSPESEAKTAPVVPDAIEPSVASRLPQEAPAPSAPRITGLVTLAAAPAIGLAPAMTLGVELGGGLRRGWLSLSIHGRFDTMTERATLDSGAAVELALFGGGLVPCGTFGLFRLCAVVRGGIAQGRAARTNQPAPEGSAYAVAAARPGILVPLGPRIALSGELEIGATIARTQLVVDGRAVWTAPPAYGSALLGVVVSFGDGS